MDLKNLHSHMKGKSALVMGTHYPIGKDGIARGVKPEDAKRLLMGEGWKLVKPSDSKKIASIPAGASEKMVEALEDATAEIERLEDYLSAATDEIDGLQKQATENGEEILRLQKELADRPAEGGKDSPLLADDGQPITDGAGGSPEPNESMDIDELKAMADKLDVSYGPNIGNELLVERIKEAMAA